MEVLKFCKVGDVKSPARANRFDAGIDFFVPNDFKKVSLEHGESVLIDGQIKVDVPRGWALVFENKSGVSSKKRLDVMACVVDHGYKGVVHYNLINNGKETVDIFAGDKIIQGVMYEVGSHVPQEWDESGMWLDAESDRGEGGFGSTGN